MNIMIFFLFASYSILDRHHFSCHLIALDQNLAKKKDAADFGLEV